jgi:hypothetical protein
MCGAWSPPPFTHRDSPAGDPDLHTHVAVANKVQTLNGRWLSIDGRVLFKANLAASETYNTALEQHLRETLDVRFAERPGADPAKRPIREIVGVDPRLNRRWSTRRAHIEARRGELAIQFQEDHGCRTPTRRPPRRSPLVALPRSATAEAEPGPCKLGGQSPRRDVQPRPHTNGAATEAAVGATSCVRPEPLKPDAQGRPGGA